VAVKCVADKLRNVAFLVAQVVGQVVPEVRDSYR
jgi:hypothetical protein